MDALVRQLRGIALQLGKAPARIVEGVQKALEFGNNTGFGSEEFTEMAEWLAEELEDEMEDVPEGGLSVPIDKIGAEVLYVPNPREYTSNPHMFQTYLKFFTYTNTDWTLSSRMFDITNWAYYLGDQENAVILVRNLVEEARRLTGAHAAVHGMRAWLQDLEERRRTLAGGASGRGSPLGSGVGSPVYERG